MHPASKSRFRPKEELIGWRFQGWGGTEDSRGGTVGPRVRTGGGGQQVVGAVGWTGVSLVLGLGAFDTPPSSPLRGVNILASFYYLFMK